MIYPDLDHKDPLPFRLILKCQNSLFELLILGDDIVSCQLDTDTSPDILKDYVFDCAKVSKR